MSTRMQGESRASRNEQAILGAALDELVGSGWAGLVPARASARSGLSITAVRSRFPDRSHLAVAVWRQRLAGVVLDHIARVVQALDSPDDALPTALHDALLPFASPNPALQAAAEILIAASYDEALAMAVREDLGAQVMKWLDGASGAEAKVQAAQHAMVISLALGLLVVAPLAMGQRLDLKPQAAIWARALRNPSRPARLPAKGIEHWEYGFVIDSGDATTDAVLRATLETVADLGYEAATMERIASASGFSQGAIFSRYPNKASLFLDATARYTAAVGAINAAELQRLAERRTPGIAEAFYIREALKPARHRHRVVLLEQLRLARTDAQIRQAMNDAIEPSRQAVMATTPGSAAQKAGAVQMELAVGQGPVLLAELAPDAWQLPYDSVTVPLAAATTNEAST